MVDIAAAESGIEAWPGSAEPRREGTFGRQEPGPSEWTRKWLALFGCRDQVEELHRLLRGLVEQHKGEVRQPEVPATDPHERLAQLKATMHRHINRYETVVGKISLWAGELRRHLKACGSNLHDLPLFFAVDEVVSAMSRGQNKLNSLPAEPKLDIDDPASLLARLRWLEAVKTHMKGVEHLPRDFGGAIRGLDEVLGRFIDELRQHRTQGCRGNTCCFQRIVHAGPDEGFNFVAVERKPVREDPYEKLWR